MAEIGPMPVAEIRRLMRRRTVEPVEDSGARGRRAYLRGYLGLAAPFITAEQLEERLSNRKGAAA